MGSAVLQPTDRVMRRQRASWQRAKGKGWGGLAGVACFMERRSEWIV
jgi:hypothetical protein